MSSHKQKTMKKKKQKKKKEFQTKSDSLTKKEDFSTTLNKKEDKSKCYLTLLWFFFRERKSAILYFSLITLIFALAVTVRFHQLDNIPPGIQYDEAYNGINALGAIETFDQMTNDLKNSGIKKAFETLLNGKIKWFYKENFGREALHINVMAIFIKFFGAESFSLRIAGALWGSITVIAFFFLLRTLNLKKVTALMGTFMLATSFWHINFSRTAYRAIMVPMLITLSLLFFFRGMKKNNQAGYGSLILSGLFLGLGAHTYIAFRIFPLVFIILTIFLFFLKQDFLKNYWKKALILIFSAFVSAAPMLFYFYNNPDDFSKRSGDVSIMNQPQPIQALAKSLASHLGAFIFYGDPNQRHNHNAMPLIPAAWIPLFLFGFFVSLKEIIWMIKSKIEKKPVSRLFLPSLVAQSIFWVMILPGVLSIEGIPHSLRIIGSIIGVMILCALPFEYVFCLFSRLKNSKRLALKPWRWNILKLAFAGLILTAILGGFFQLGIYFNVWASNQKTIDSFERKLVDLGRLAKELPSKETNIIITAPQISISDDHRKSSLITTEYIGFPVIEKFVYWKPVDALRDTTCQNVLYIFQEPDQWLLENFKKKCPLLKQEKIISPKGLYGFWVMR